MPEDKIQTLWSPNLCVCVSVLSYQLKKDSLLLEHLAVCSLYMCEADNRRISTLTIVLTYRTLCELVK